MNSPPDFEFSLGKGRCLKGRGWRGLCALGLLLIGLTASVHSASSVAQPLGRLFDYLK
jgi:hypothetical protein